MSGLSFWRGLCVKIVEVPVAAYLLGLLIPGIAAYQALQVFAVRQTEEKAVALARSFDAAHHYPDEAAATRTAAQDSPPKPLGAPKGVVMPPYRYRQVALDPTNAADRPDANEARLLQAFMADNHLTRSEQEISEQGGHYVVIATPIVLSQDRCLRCHGSPNAAPAWLQHQFGKTAGYGWKKGQVVGASLVYVSSDLARMQALQIFLLCFKVVGLLTLTCLLLLAWRTNVMIARPIRQMLATCEAIRKGEWGARFDVRFPDELQTLAMSLQNTTIWLRGQVAKEEKLRALFQQFVPAAVAARALGKDADQILAGTRHSATVMIINIRNFKLLMEHLPPDQTVTTLNEFFSAVNRVIVANKGLVSKYMGDSVMAIFGIPLGNDNHTLCAVRAALGISQALQSLYVRLDEEYGWQLGVGVGISTGEPIVGFFGSSEHMEYTLLGDVVGEAHLLESITKSVPEEDTVVISEVVYRGIMSDVHVYDLGEKEANGKTIHAYVVQGLRSEARSVVAA